MDRIYRVGIEEVPKRLTLNEQEHLRLTFIVMPGVSAEIPFEINIGKAGVNLDRMKRRQIQILKSPIRMVTSR